MKEWILSVFTIVFISSIINYILPDGKTSKLIKSVFSILIILVVVKPILNINKNFNSVDVFISGYEQEMQSNYIDYIYNKKAQLKCDECKKILEDLGIDNPEIVIEYEFTEDYIFLIKKVKINLKNSVINSDKAHTDIIKEVNEKISLYLDITDEDLIIYE